jgi:acyl carrier protein
MNHSERVRAVLRDALQLGERADALTEQSRLLGAIPEFDSMAVVSVIGMLEEEYGFTVEDDELSADVFETFGSLVSFVAAKVQS